MIKIDNKFIIIKLYEISLQSMFISTGVALCLNDDMIEVKLFVSLLIYILNRLLFEYISVAKYYSILGREFQDDLEYQIWKYSQIFFRFKLAMKTLEISFSLIWFVYFFVKIEQFYNILLKNYGISFNFYSFFNILFFIFSQLNSIDIAMNLDYFTQNNNQNTTTLEIKKNIIVENEDCCICLSSGNEWGELPCKHQFHYDCISKWLQIKNHCPICRQ